MAGLHLQHRLQLSQGQGVQRRRLKLGRPAVPEVELVIAAALLQVGLPQEAAVVQTHQQRQVRLVADELPVVDPLFDDHLRHAQAQGGVGGSLDGHVVVVVDVRGAAIGGYQHYFSPLVPRLRPIVVAGYHGVDGVGVRVHVELGMEHVVGAAGGVELAEGEVDARREVVDHGVDIQPQPTDELHHPAEGEGSQQASLAWGPFLDYRLRPYLLDGVQDVVGDLGQGLVPGDLLPLPLTTLAGPLQGVQHPLRRVQQPAPGRPLLAAHGVHVGDALLDDGQRAGLLLAEDHPVLNVDADRAVAGVAVHAVGGHEGLVPLPTLTVEVLRSLILSTGGLCALLEGFQGERGCEHETLPSLAQHQAAT
jgi:hypothetical protein